MESRELLTIGGTATTLFPAVGMFGSVAAGYDSCATLISPQYVLTAANVIAGVAATDLRFQTEGQIYSGTQATVHPGFEPALRGQDEADDLAIVKLDRPVTGVAPVPLYRYPYTPKISDELTLVGFGATSAAAATTYVGKTTGKTTIDAVTDRLVKWLYDNRGQQSVAVNEEGSPALFRVGGIDYLVGVNSIIDTVNGGLGTHVFDTRVDYYASWIDGVISPTTLPTVSIAATDPVAAETGAGQAANPGLFTFSRSGSTTGSLTVNYKISGVARNGTDYATIPGSPTMPAGQASIPMSITIPAGKALVTLPIIVIDDKIIEATEPVRLTLSLPSPYSNYAIDTAQSAATVDIYDNDAPKPLVSVTATDSTAAETAPGLAANPGRFAVTRAGPTTLPLTVLYTLTSTATNGADYNLLTGSVTIPAGKLSADVNIVVIDDPIRESTETVILNLTPGLLYTADTSRQSALVNISDNDAVTRPANDNFAAAVLIATGQTLIGSNVNATREASEPNHGAPPGAPGIPGGRSVWWSWTPTATGSYTISTAGSTFDTILSVYTRNPDGTLKCEAGNDNDGTNRTSKVTFTAIRAKQYWIAVDGFAGVSGNIKLAVT